MSNNILSKEDVNYDCMSGVIPGITKQQYAFAYSIVIDGCSKVDAYQKHYNATGNRSTHKKEATRLSANKKVKQAIDIMSDVFKTAFVEKFIPDTEPKDIIPNKEEVLEELQDTQAILTHAQILKASARKTMKMLQEIYEAGKKPIYDKEGNKKPTDLPSCLGATKELNKMMGLYTPEKVEIGIGGIVERSQEQDSSANSITVNFVKNNKRIDCE